MGITSEGIDGRRRRSQTRPHDHHHACPAPTCPTDAWPSTKPSPSLIEGLDRHSNGTPPRGAPAGRRATSPVTSSASPRTPRPACPGAATPTRKPRRCATSRPPARRRGCAPRSRRCAALLDVIDDDAWAGPSGVPDLTLGEGVLTLWFDTYIHADDIRAAVGRDVGARRRPRRGDRVPRRASSPRRDGVRPRSRSTAWAATTSAAAAARSPATRCSSRWWRPAGPTPRRWASTPTSASTDGYAEPRPRVPPVRTARADRRRVRRSR